MAGEFDDPTGWVGCYEAALASCRARDFVAAIRQFEKVINLRGQDRASWMMIERCRQALQAPAGAEWDDVTIARTK
jgi:adenylate cyclase